MVRREQAGGGQQEEASLEFCLRANTWLEDKYNDREGMPLVGGLILILLSYLVFNS